ncbi:MAG: glycosyltransferase [Fodinibius sp.]|nr:glycosyltransferase [Fodinibius sp.]
MDDTQPLVSAILTTHNRADLLPRALDSIIAQTYANIEIIVVDDGSKDNTPQIIDEYRDNIMYIRNEDSQGACRARNIGISAANGVFVAGLDDDDAWHKQRIERLVNAYSDDMACVTSDTLMVYPNYEASWRKRKIISMDKLLYTNLVGNQVLVRRDRIQEVGGFDERLTAAQDYDLWVRLCDRFGPIRNVQKPLQTVYMDRDQGRITGRSAYKGYLQFYEKHKHRMNRRQRKYQLYNIRRAQNKDESVSEFVSCVPPFRYWKELKRIGANTFLAD